MNSRRISISPLPFFLVLILLLGAVGFLAWQAGYLDGVLPPEARSAAIATNTASPTQPVVELPTPQPIVESETTALQLPDSDGDSVLPGMIVFAMTEAGYTHIFAYHPERLVLTRLTYGMWDDLYPALSPDGSQIAFSSNRGGAFDLYLLDLASGKTRQITEDLAYDGHPAWSSDGLWLAYDKYLNNNLDVYTTSAITTTAEVRVTTHPAPDFQPAWQPASSLLAFTSARTGALDIFLADTAETDTPRNYTFNITADQSHPVWSPDGSRLTWSAPNNGFPTLFQAEAAQQAALAVPVTNADLAVWDPSGKFLLTVQSTPDQSYLAIQELDGRYRLLPTLMPGPITAVSWGLNRLPSPMPAALRQAADAQPETPWLEKLIPSSGALYGRQNVIDLPDIHAPHSALNALAVEPFFALKDRMNIELGWDVLSDLENMAVTIAEPLDPGRQQDWLYTGRAFALHPALIDYGYMLVVKEDYGAQSYWRIYLKPLDQSGAAGMPLAQFSWDFLARTSGETSAYESGGKPNAEIPSGYWVDFTALAQAYGWERQPALSNWRSYYQGARFNIFAITSGLAWEDAMRQIWPPEVFLEQGTP